MKTRDVSKLSCVVLGESGLKGQVLVSWDDAVGFAVYEFRVAGGDTAQLKALHGNQNHVYYCIEGKCSFDIAENRVTFKSRLYNFSAALISYS